ncbi:nuclear transport factor 2 family protein [Paraburkholderia caballeronis]|uniref:SnoaL-like domain-containing protein n=1 Tax=Paraburkholderia caballeronis TaxID=416943 RepID=A0A1H7P683_9BURK|nr:nuclear transport factor 2 family protein [Paraburkholderia caballeronis]PXW25362.1 SnoaL-like protein [Paraburkholderia caballeronis]PXX00969.1 SnoaL-like protein [Paraburkholderia caballeronis]RAJ99678.1 SnoaL-like protein [Paraburkholderia caballeronis]SEE40429.1 SnoaL-like domain-containing protein [Paraburkholderia caballeronis]SEL31311.1 SnoaL-like domain-containing protein [Paraburkholderia caballeronis]
MSVPLPESITAFFHASNDGTAAAPLKNAFTANAAVVDEHQTHQGYEAIEAWLADAQRKYAYTVEPLSATTDGDTITVLARCAGNFPGSPVQLEHVFKLSGDRIARLEIR